MAELKPGDLLSDGFSSNYTERALPCIIDHDGNKIELCADNSNSRVADATPKKRDD